MHRRGGVAVTAIGIDVGGTKIAGGLVTADGQVLATGRRRSPASDVSAISDTIADLVRELTEQTEDDVVAVGVAAAGFVDRDRTTLVFAPNLAWRDVPLKQEMQDRLGLPVVLENDANAAAWGEFRFGAAEDADDLLLLTVGTGVGGGIVHDGVLLRGARGFGAEVGHVQVVPEGRPCPCGVRGCLEQYASGSALVTGARTRVAAGGDGAAEVMSRLAPGESLDGPFVTTLAHERNPLALAAFDDLGHWLGVGAATIAAVLDPSVVVIGGGVVEAGDLLLDPTRRALASHLTASDHRPAIEVRPATLGNDAGVVGAADLAARSTDG
ncbi:ROK family glucokinase [Nocardioidaceae bacterium]|nr:ROK family glucokinase [Nocardioidaceae bacterium]